MHFGVNHPGQSDTQRRFLQIATQSRTSFRHIDKSGTPGDAACMFDSAFTATWDDRAADARANADAIRDAGLVLPLWQGKPLLAADGTLVWVAPDHPLLADAPGGAAVFLGHHAGRARFAALLSGWTPPDAPAGAGFLDATRQHHPAAPKDAHFADLRAAMGQLTAPEAALAATARGLFNWHQSHGFCAACGARSALAEGGWQRVCPHCATRHFPRTDPVVIMLVTHDNDLLLGRSHNWPETLYSALAGFVEPGETPESAVAREVWEETGISTGPVRYVGAQPWPFPNSLMLGCIAAARDRAITLDPELADARWLSREQVLASWAGLDTSITPARPGAIAHALIGAWLAGRL